MIGRSGERGSGISVLAARHDNDDDDEMKILDIYYNSKKLLSCYCLQRTIIISYLKPYNCV